MDEEEEEEISKKYLTRKQKRQIRRVSRVEDRQDFFSLPELNPPPMLPQGNVGTPLDFIQERVRECSKFLPPF